MQFFYKKCLSFKAAEDKTIVELFKRNEYSYTGPCSFLSPRQELQPLPDTDTFW